MNRSIRFGTDGWRGLIADDFTFERVRLVAASLADQLIAGGAEGRTVVVGWDRRFLSEDFAKAVSEVLAGAGFTVQLSRDFVPTPAVSLAVRDGKAAAGVMITASHNPGRWNGFKVKEPFGGSASPETTAALEKLVAARLAEPGRIPRMGFEEATRRGKIERVELGDAYRARLAQLVDLKAIAKSGFRVVVDPIHGAGTGTLARLLEEAGVEVAEIRREFNPLFGGVNPEPIDENLGALRRAMRAVAGGDQPVVGLATDGDADRIGAMDENLAFFDSHRIFASIFKHLLEVRRLPGSVVQTFSSTVMVRRLAKKHGVTRIETPIGFKHVADHMLKGGVMMGGEESGGLGFSFHLPERDGALSGLLLLEACAYAGLPPRALLEKTFAEVGTWEYDRVDLHLDPGRTAEIVQTVKTMTPAEIAGAKVAERLTLDGIKYVFGDDSWLLLRPSGTEPVLRIYSEAPTRARVKELLDAGRALAGA